jgi:hypothetical protein
MLKPRVSVEKSSSKVRVEENGVEGSRKSTVSKVSHTLSVALAERLEEFAFFQRVSESAVIEHSLASFFAQSEDDMILGDLLRREGAGRRRKA